MEREPSMTQMPQAVPTALGVTRSATAGYMQLAYMEQPKPRRTRATTGPAVEVSDKQSMRWASMKIRVVMIISVRLFPNLSTKVPIKGEVRIVTKQVISSSLPADTGQYPNLWHKQLFPLSMKAIKIPIVSIRIVTKTQKGLLNCFRSLKFMVQLLTYSCEERSIRQAFLSIINSPTEHKKPSRQKQHPIKFPDTRLWKQLQISGVVRVLRAFPNQGTVITKPMARPSYWSLNHRQAMAACPTIRVQQLTPSTALPINIKAQLLFEVATVQRTCPKNAPAVRISIPTRMPTLSINTPEGIEKKTQGRAKRVYSRLNCA